MTDIEIINAVRTAGEQSSGKPWATLDEIANALSKKPEAIRHRLQEMANLPILASTFRWHNIAPEGIIGISPEVGYNKDQPLFRVL